MVVLLGRMLRLGVVTGDRLFCVCNAVELLLFGWRLRGCERSSGVGDGGSCDAVKMSYGVC